MYYTAHDAIDYLMQTTGGGAQDQEHRVLRAALHHSYRDVCDSKDWLFFVTEGAITITAGKNNYVLPDECSGIDALILPDRTTTSSYISPAEWVRLEKDNLTLGEPVYYTVMKSSDPLTFDRWEVRIAGMLPAGTVVRYTYRRRPKPLTLMGYETQCRTGFVTVTGTTVQGTTTNFPAKSLGAVIRIGTPQQYPEPLSGFYPYQAQARISAYTDSDTMTIDRAIGNFTNCRYVISDLLDCSPGMFTAILSGSELWLARLMGKPIDAAMQLYQRDWRLAAEQDVVAPISGRRAPYDRVPDGDSAKYAGVYSPLGPDQGT